MNIENEYFEGKKTARYSSHYERNYKNRYQAILHHGTKCRVCGFDFRKMYGDRGKDFIEVHHLIPVSKLKGPTKVNPKKDMTVLCSNCHRMIHRFKDDVLTPNQLKTILKTEYQKN
jgi:5-methylcytosine-specific restriction protein A